MEGAKSSSRGSGRRVYRLTRVTKPLPEKHEVAKLKVSFPTPSSYEGCWMAKEVERACTSSCCIENPTRPFERRATGPAITFIRMSDANRDFLRRILVSIVKPRNRIDVCTIAQNRFLPHAFRSFAEDEQFPSCAPFAERFGYSLHLRFNLRLGTKLGYLSSNKPETGAQRALRGAWQ